MPHIVETTVYHLNELGEGGRDKARNWYRETAFDDDWYESVYEDFETICGVLGVHLKTRPVRLFGGGTRAKSCIYFSGFWSQGDGACYAMCAIMRSRWQQRPGFRAFWPMSLRIITADEVLRWR